MGKTDIDSNNTNTQSDNINKRSNYFNKVKTILLIELAWNNTEELKKLKKLKNILKKNGLGIKYINLENFEKEDQLNLMSTAVKQNGLSIKYVIEYLKTLKYSIFHKDEILKIYLTAIKQNGLAFEYISQNLDNSICEFNDDDKLKAIIAALNEDSNSLLLKKVNIKDSTKIKKIIEDNIGKLTMIDLDLKENKSEIETINKILKLINYLDEEYQKNLLIRIREKRLERIKNKELDTKSLFKESLIKEYGSLDDVKARKKVIINKENKVTINPIDLVENVPKGINVKFKKGQNINTNTKEKELIVTVEISDGNKTRYLEVPIKILNKNDYILEKIKEKENIKVKLGNYLNPRSLLRKLPAKATVSFENEEETKNIINEVGSHDITVIVKYSGKERKIENIKIQVCKEIETENVPSIKEDKIEENKIENVKKAIIMIYESINNKTLNLERTFWTILKTIENEEISNKENKDKKE